MLLLMIVGFLGVIFPLIPGVPFMFLTTLAYYFGLGSRFSVEEIFTLALTAALALVVEYSSGNWREKMRGPAGRGILYGAVGLAIGLWLLPPYGGFIGMSLGFIIAELLASKIEITGAEKPASLIPETSGIALNFLIALVFVLILSVNFWNDL